MSDISGQLNTALEYHKAGKLPEAEIIYRNVLEQVPDNVDALNLLGILMQQLAKYDEAVSYIKRAVEIKPSAYFYKNLGNVFLNMNDIQEAIDCFKEGIDFDPDDAGLWFNLAMSYKMNGEINDSIRCYKRAIDIKPKFIEAYFNLGNIYKDSGNTDAAIDCYLTVLGYKPEDEDSHINLGNLYLEKNDIDNAVKYLSKAVKIRPDRIDVYIKLYQLLVKKGEIDEAVQYFSIAAELKPDDELYLSMGNVLLEQKLYQKAIKYFNKALEINCCNTKILYNLGLAYKSLCEYSTAEKYYLKALEINPDYIEAHNNLGVVLRDTGRIEEAVAEFQKALKLMPDYPEANQNIGAAYLIKGDFDNGWEKFDYGLNLKEAKYGVKRASFTQPKWDGASLDGKTVYIYYEREFGGGFGDSIQLARFLPLIHEQNAKILLKVQPELRHLYMQSDIKANILEDSELIENIEFDFHCPVMSLPVIFKAKPENIPFKEGYLKADPAKAEKYKKEYFTNNSFKIGIVWSGNQEYLKTRFLNLNHFNSICKLPDVKVYSLQKDEGIEDQLDNLPDDIEITNLGKTFDDFSHTAAAIENLDLVIATDTSVAHLAGALGKRTWVLLQFMPEWRWLLDREDSPWYDSIRLFRQKELGNWTDVMDRVTDTIKTELLN